MPVRVSGSVSTRSASRRSARRRPDNAQKSLRSGVTTIRLVGSQDGIDFELKKQIDSGTFVGPRIHTAGRAICATGGPFQHEADGPAEFTKLVREEIKRGATWIKLGLSVGLSEPHGDIADSQLTDEELRAAIGAAHRNQIKVTRA